MDSQHEETIFRITAQYVAEWQAGQKPKISEYIARYPRYANEIANFATYYHTVEAALPVDPSTVPDFAPDFPIAIDYAWQNISTPSLRGISTLLRTAKKRRLSPAQLAEKLELGIDIVLKLEQRKITASSLPSILMERLANVLQQPVEAVSAYFVAANKQISYSHKLAESAGTYRTPASSSDQTQSFRQALEESTGMTEEQKASWYKLLDGNGG